MDKCKHGSVEQIKSYKLSPNFTEIIKIGVCTEFGEMVWSEGIMGAEAWKILRRDNE